MTIFFKRPDDTDPDSPGREYPAEIIGIFEISGAPDDEDGSMETQDVALVHFYAFALPDDEETGLPSPHPFVPACNLVYLCDELEFFPVSHFHRPVALVPDTGKRSGPTCRLPSATIQKRAKSRVPVTNNMGRPLFFFLDEIQ